MLIADVMYLYGLLTNLCCYTTTSATNLLFTPTESGCLGVGDLTGMAVAIQLTHNMSRHKSPRPMLHRVYELKIHKL